MVTLIIKVTELMINMIIKIRITTTITERNNNNSNNDNNIIIIDNHKHENTDNSDYQSRNNKQ